MKKERNSSLKKIFREKERKRRDRRRKGEGKKEREKIIQIDGTLWPLGRLVAL